MVAATDAASVGNQNISLYSGHHRATTDSHNQLVKAATVFKML